jgi:hypothetical protein
MMDKFEDTKSNMDAYGKNNFFEYLDCMTDPTVYGTEYDILLLCESLKVSIDVFSSSSISFQNGYMDCPPPLSFGETFKFSFWNKEGFVIGNSNTFNITSSVLKHILVV